jgi:alkylation response protein AidB-like acyl-CoA dehydrogenase
MDLALTDAQRALQRELREWCTGALPKDWTGTSGQLASDDWEFASWFNRQLAKQGWLVPGWPVEHGGRGMGVLEQYIISEELSYHRAPPGNRDSGVNMLGPILMQYGREDQQQRFLPGIASGEDCWAQGYSEPNAGSDLASLQTRADRDGDDYVINGTKIWSSDAHHSNWCFLLARTDQDAPKHRGISLILIPMDAPGVTVSPLINMADGHDFNQMFFENVRVPVSNRVGDEGRGWYVGVAILDLERACNAATSIGFSRRLVDDLWVYMRDGPRSSTTAPDRVHRHRLADLEIRARIVQFAGYRCALAIDRGEPLAAEASMAKILFSELEQAVTTFAIDLFGPAALLREPEVGHPPFAGRLAGWYLWASPATSYGGANEIERNIIAQRGLGLPRP